VRPRLGEEDAPAVLADRDVPEVRPALPADVDRRTEVDVLGRQLGPHLGPPPPEPRLPGLQRPLQPPVVGQPDVAVDLLLVVGAQRPRSRAKLARCRVPSRVRARWGPAAPGRVKIQFCQAESRPKILDSSVSGPANRWLGSMPVRASGLSEDRSSRAMRI